jgi:HEAT repeat protein
MNSANGDSLPSLLIGLRDPEKEKRAWSVQEIVRAGDVAVPDLTVLLKDEDWKVRYRAAEALGMIRADKAIPDLINTCSDRKDHVRYMAAKALGLMKACDAVSTLVALLSDEHPYSRGIAAEGLGIIGDKTAREGLLIALRNESNPAIREKIEKSLNSLQ